MSENVYFAAFFFPAAAIAIVFFMKYLARVFEARAGGARDAAYRTLSSDVLASQREVATLLSAQSAQLDDIRARLVSLEKILKEVE